MILRLKTGSFGRIVVFGLLAAGVAIPRGAEATGEKRMMNLWSMVTTYLAGNWVEIAGFVTTLATFLASTVIWSIGDLILLGRAYTIVAALAPPTGRGRYMAIYGTSWGLAAIAAPLVGTQLIERGGPFPSRRDGVIFGNFERRLPIRQRGYYHEYTVPTPGARTRGARRIIAGDTSHGEYYYTEDHYRTFWRIRE